MCCIERKPDVNYEAGWKRYGFAAPFKKDGAEPNGDASATYPLDGGKIPAAATVRAVS